VAQLSGSTQWQCLLDRQDKKNTRFQAEQQKAEQLVELIDFFGAFTIDPSDRVRQTVTP
jgi:hypothetical protein